MYLDPTRNVFTRGFYMDFSISFNMEKLNDYGNNNTNPLPCVQLCITNFNLKLILNFEKTLWRGMEWRNQNTKLIC